jgi:ribosomal protein L40E
VFKVRLVCTTWRRFISRSTGELADRIEKLLHQIHAELQSVEGRLRDNKKCYIMQSLVCMCCGRTHPISARKCHPCSNINLLVKYCTSDYRIAEFRYFEEITPLAIIGTFSTLFCKRNCILYIANKIDPQAQLSGSLLPSRTRIGHASQER